MEVLSNSNSTRDLVTVATLRTRTGPPSMELISCPICSSTRHKVLFSRMDHTHHVTNERFDVVRCKSCSMVFINPRPGPDEISRYYPPDFYEVEISKEELLEQKCATLEARRKLTEDMRPSRLLDVGCQKGEFLHWMARAGWQVQGVEFSSTPPNLFGMPIFRGRLEDFVPTHGGFDLITLWAVLEHVHNPIGTLRDVSRLLTPRGRVLILVPNFRSIPGRFMRHDDVPRHLLMFDRRTLTRAAAAAGLSITRWIFSDDIFSGSTRGFLNFVVKRAFGESYDEILAQNRTPSRWPEFTGTLHGRPSRILRFADRIDLKYYQRLDALMRRLGRSFIMTAQLEHKNKNEMPNQPNRNQELA